MSSGFCAMNHLLAVDISKGKIKNDGYEGVGTLVHLA